MADSLVEQCSKLHIGNDEDDIIDLGDKLEVGQEDKLSLQLVGHLLTEKPLNFETLKHTMMHVWSVMEGVIVRALESNLFMFQFFHWKDKDKILSGRPWCFEQRLLILQEINKDIQPSHMTLIFSPFWIRLYNLPFGCRLDEKVKAVARGLGEVLEVEEDFLDLYPYRRVRVLLDCTKPLKRFQNNRVRGGVMVKISIKYERIPHFCFHCGHMSHLEKDCLIVNDEDEEYETG
ncbi:uncharacterized protein LOC130813479 [Amaranthus tricolor]|uniref:uncharacterized protein LOC130813479 n=1 Tax=Amaranthus tricolor TaxID=29722 RepID=UPI00258D9C2E|nr:uncharacterized protein LOC130813479 [Amaranthus tricolor]